ncbi:zinc finger protein 239-like isoform X3 [Maniola hyperantus]|uniref:zinc finger protein 239-like isoform X3 n=1 Tax=Aphantopus hyperantus TaxID=2795564 RepID=UPI003747D340
MSTKSCTKHIKMEEQLLVPKEEVFEELEVTLEPDCNNKELIVPKDEFSNTSPHSDTASDQQMCKPIKTETILSNEIVELQKVIKSSEDTEVSAGCLRTHIKRKPAQAEASLSIESAHTLNDPVRKRRAPRHGRVCCNVCRKAYRSKKALVVHMRTHTGEKPYTCDHCQAKFSRRGCLIEHIRTHTGEKPYACCKCRAKFSQKSSLDVHIRTHTGDKPYACGKCQAKFSQKGNLMTHMRTHTGEKPYACCKCQAKFAQKHSLNVHMRTHTAYLCDLCHTKFLQKGHSKRDMMTDRGEQSHFCDLCHTQYARISHW